MKVLWFIYPFCSLFMIVGIGLSIWTFLAYRKGQKVTSWPTVNAHIQHCELKTESDSDGATYIVEVRYSYDVGGQSFKGTKIHPGYTSSNFEGHHELYDRLREAKVVRARYNKLDPAESYLLAGSFTTQLATFFGGMIFFSAGLFFLLTFHFAIAGNGDFAAALEIVK